MKRSLALFLTLILLLTLTACGKSAVNNTDATADEQPTQAAEQLSEYEEKCRDAMKSSLLQGTAVAAVDGKEILSLSNGKADKKADVDNSADAVYQFASVTKQFTAAAIMLLYEDGKLDLQDTLDKYFPDYAAGKDVTVHMLLCMRAGIPDYINNYDDSVGMVDDYNIAFDISADKTASENRTAIKDWLFTQELRFAPDSDYEYCNSCYFLLGEIIEQVSGTTYQEYLTQRILEPLGMTTAGFCDAYDNDSVTVAKAYSRGEAGEWTQFPGARFGCGDLLCSPRDLVKWETALINGKVVSESSWEKMITPYSTDPEESNAGYGYGLFVGEDTSGLHYVYHTGHFPSFYSMVLMIPEEHYAGVTVSNHSDSTATGLCAKLAKIYIETKADA